ncbi:MAG TPA: hypothetical protein VFT12_15235 [Thermoanaerobaculia bacterium]|nr:hypothetical protein [Thermoanaerobaculia bacterium]
MAPMTFGVRRLAAALGLLLAACANPVTRADWQQMTPAEKTLYVNSLLGAEKARERKGGNDRAIDEPPAVIVSRIDAAYAAGDQRPPEEIFNTPAVRPDSLPPPRPASP